MARLALAASLLLSLFLLSHAHRLRSDLVTEGGDVLSITSESSDSAAIRLPSDKPASRADESIQIAEATTALPVVPIEASLIPIGRDFPHPRLRVVGRSFWRRLGHHCRHLHRGGIDRGAVIPYGDDMILPAEHVRRGYEGGRVFAGETDPNRLHPMMLKEISVEELAKQREMGLPWEMRPFPRFRPDGNGAEGDGGLVKRFLDLLNRH